MSRYIFPQSMKVIDSVEDAKFSDAQVEAEPMIYGGSWDWTRKHGGPITQAVMDKIHSSVQRNLPIQARLGYHPVIDTKSVLLMEGQYPCIPGWHCDGVIRAAQGAQPDMSTLGEPIQHFVCVVGGDGTEFLVTPWLIDGVDSDNVWASVNAQIPEDAHTHQLHSGDIVSFNRDQLHRGPAATARGWRYFFRLSFYHMPAMNVLRNQVQVYVDVGKGW